MTEESFFLTFHSNKYPICTQFNGIDKCSKQLYKDLVFSSDHTHIVNSDVSDVVFQSLINYMNNGTLPQITKENYLEYLMINEEFQILTEFIKKSEEEFGTDFKCIVQLNDIKINQDNSFLENQISKNLDLYLKQQFNQMKNLPFNCLCNIFNNPERKLEDQELAYQFIKDKSKDDPNLFVLLKSLEGDKLSRDSQIECERERVERFDFCPNNLSILSFKEHQEQLYQSIKSIKEELNSLKISQKQNLEIISNQNQEIVDLKDIVAQLKTSLQDKDSCYLSYFGEKQGNYPYASLHVEANKETKHESKHQFYC